MMGDDSHVPQDNNSTLGSASFVVVGDSADNTLAPLHSMNDSEKDLIQLLTERLEEMTDVVKSSLESEGHSSSHGDNSNVVGSSSHRTHQLHDTLVGIVNNPMQNSQHEAQSRGSRTESMRTIDNLRQENGDLKRRVRELEMEIGQLKEENQSISILTTTTSDSDKFQQMRNAFLQVKKLKKELSEKEEKEEKVQLDLREKEDYIKELTEIMQGNQLEYTRRLHDLEEEISELRQSSAVPSVGLKDNAEQTEECNKYKKRIKELEEKITELEEDIEDYKASASTSISATESKEMADKLKQSVKDCDKYKTKARELENKVQQLQEQIEDIKNSSSTAVSSIESLASTSTDPTKLRAEIKKYKEKVKELNQKVEDNEDEIDRLSDELEHERKKNKKELEKVKKQNEKRMREIETELQDVNDELKDEKEKFQAAAKKLTRTESQKMKYKEQVSNLEQERSYMQEKFGDMGSLSSSLDESFPKNNAIINQLRREKEDLEVRLAEATSTKTEKISELSAEHEKEIRAVESRLQSTETEQSSDEFRKLSEDNAALAAKVKELEKTVNIMNDKKKQLLNEIRSVKSEKARLEIRVVTLEKTSVDNNSAVEECETLKAKLSRKEDELQREKKRLHNEINEMNERMTGHSQNDQVLVNLREENAKLTKDLQDAVMRISNLHGYMKDNTRRVNGPTDMKIFDSVISGMNSLEQEVSRFMQEDGQKTKYIDSLRKEIKLKETRQKDIEMQNFEERQHIAFTKERQKEAEDAQRAADCRCKALTDMVILLQDRLELITSPNYPGRLQPFPIYDGADFMVGQPLQE